MACKRRGFIFILICLLVIESNVAEKQLPKLKEIVKTIHGKYDIIDCVETYKQPAFNHPLLKNHKIQMLPEITRHQYNAFEESIFTQTLLEIDECPEGTVPIKRLEEVDEEHLMEMKRGSMFHQTRKNGRTTYNNVSKALSKQILHEYATARVEDGEYFGSKFSATIWSPYVEPHEFSSAQTWIKGGPSYAPFIIEVGWVVYPHFYKDNLTRLFIFWTTNEYEVGCYNLLCAGFVQISRKIYPGMSLVPISQYGSQNYQVTCAVFKAQGNWYLQVNEETVGYWLGNVYPFLGGVANSVAWGGEIVDTMKDGNHTKTQMGSGHCANEKYLKAASIFNIQVNTREENPDFQRPRLVYPFLISKSKYYSLLRVPFGKNYKDHFFFGGPGYSNDHCT